MGPRGDATPVQVIRFDEIELDEARFELRRRGRPVPVGPRAFDLLRYLVHHRDRVVTRDELLATVWRGTSVVDSAIGRAVCEARRALGERADAQSTIATVRGRGYQFVAKVETERAPARAPLTTSGSAESSPLIGRDAQLGELRRRTAHALGGAGGFTLLAGEPGIGKTRLIEELTAEVASAGSRVLLARCHEGEGTPAYWPWTQVVRELMASARPAGNGAEPTELAALFPSLSFARGTEPRARFELFDAVTTLLERAADAAPILIAIDDLHWADDASLHLLVHAASALRRVRTMLLLSLRITGRVSAQLSTALGALARLDPASTLTIPGLADEDIASFVQSSTGEVLGVADIERLASATGGNPLFLTQLAHLRFKGALPESVLHAIARHLEILREPCRDALARASVFGRGFSPAILSTLSDELSPDELLDLLREAERAGVIVPDGDAFVFAHALVRDALYGRLSTVERSALHARAARALALRSEGKALAPLSMIAHHYLRAAGSGYLDEAIQYATRAAEDALTHHGYETAMELYERALAALDLRCEPSRRRELLMGLGVARSLSGDLTGSRVAFEEAARLARTLEMPTEMTRAAFLAAMVPESGSADTPRIELLEQGLRAAGDEGSGAAAMCMARLATASWATEQPARRLMLAERAVRTARAAEDSEALAHALLARHDVQMADFPAADTRTLADELEAIAAAKGASSDVHLMAVQASLDEAVMKGDPEGTRAQLTRYGRLATELRRPYHMWRASLHRTMFALAEGRLADAEASIRESDRLVTRGVEEAREVFGSAQLFMLRREQGRLGELEPLLRKLIGELPALASLPAALAYVAVHYGDPGEARHLLLERFGSGAPWRPEINRSITLAFLAEVAVTLRIEDVAGAIYRELLPWAGVEIVISSSIAVDGCGSRMLGALAATLGRWEDAEAHFARALEIDERFGARPFVAYTHAAWAELLARRARRGDAARAERHAARAASLAHEVGMPKLLERLTPFVGAKRASRLGKSAEVAHFDPAGAGIGNPGN